MKNEKQERGLGISWKRIYEERKLQKGGGVRWGQITQKPALRLMTGY